MTPTSAPRPPDLSSLLETTKSKPETRSGRFGQLDMPDDEPTPPPTTAASGELVSIVDDDPTARRLMRFWLERAGYTVVEHESARSVLDHDGETPSLACVDLGLGEVTGIKVIQHLRARDAELPIIVVTAQRELETAVAAMQAGAYDYVTKPLDRDRLLLLRRPRVWPVQGIQRGERLHGSGEHCERSRIALRRARCLPAFGEPQFDVAHLPLGGAHHARDEVEPFVFQDAPAYPHSPSRQGG